MPTTNARYRQQRQAARTILTPEQRANAADLARYRDEEGRLVTVRPGLAEQAEMHGEVYQTPQEDRPPVRTPLAERGRPYIVGQLTLEQRIAALERDLAAMKAIERDRWGNATRVLGCKTLPGEGADK